MPAPYKHTFTILSGTTTSEHGAYIADSEVRSIQFPAAMTGATISFTGALIEKKTGNNEEPSTFTAVKDSSGNLVTVTVATSAIVSLSEAQRDALTACHWVKIVSASSEGADRSVILGGISRFR